MQRGKRVWTTRLWPSNNGSNDPPVLPNDHDAYQTRSRPLAISVALADAEDSPFSICSPTASCHIVCASALERYHSRRQVAFINRECELLYNFNRFCFSFCRFNLRSSCGWKRAENAIGLLVPFIMSRSRSMGILGGLNFHIINRLSIVYGGERVIYLWKKPSSTKIAWTRGRRHEWGIIVSGIRL